MSNLNLSGVDSTPFLGVTGLELDLKLSSQIYNIFALALSKNIFVKNILAVQFYTLQSPVVGVEF